MLERKENIIKQKLHQYILPGIMLTAALQVGNIVDSVLVGNLLGPDAMSAVKIGMAVDNVVEIPGYVLGVGGSVAAGILLGKRELDKARRVFSGTLLITILCGFLFSIASIGSNFYARLLCGNSGLTADAAKFIFVTLLLAPFLGVALQMISYVAVDNNPSLASAYVILANVLNLSLDYILLRYTSLGTAGAALSTSLGYGLALLLLIQYIKSPKRMLSFVNPFKDLWDSFVTAAKAGMPTLLYMIFLTVKDITLNSMIVQVIGAQAMVIYTVCYNVTLCVQLFVGGIEGLISSIGTVLYGEKDYFGIRSLVKHVLRYSYSVLVVLFVFLFIKPDLFVKMFGITDAALVGVASTALRIFLLALPFYMWNKFMVTYYQSTDKTVLASIVTSLQTCVAIVPLAYIFVFLAKVMGMDLLNALIFSFVASEVITILVASIYRMIKYKKMGVLALPKVDVDGTEFTVCDRLEDVSETVKQVFAFATAHNIAKETANRIAVATEEMLSNILKYGGKQAKYVDVFIHLQENKLVIRLTDNGIPFDPTTYQQDEEEFQIHGIEVAKKMANRVEYLRTLDLNHTMIEMDV